MKSEKVKDIRRDSIIIDNNPIIYYWWFNVKSFEKLLEKLNSEIKPEKVLKKIIKNQQYGLLYIGQAKKGNDRLINYHILDKNNFHLKGVENGRLSSLRTTLCGLLDLPMSKNKSTINDFMDENCIVEWELCKINELNDFERNKIQSNYLPLNYQHTKNVLTKTHRKILSESKKRMRK